MTTPVLIGEVLASSGPRKNWDPDGKPRDPDLGEDAAGLIMTSTGASWIWMADGTSDMSLIAGFSSRRLAQDLGSTFTASLIANQTSHEEALSDPIALLRESAIQVNTLWTRDIEANAPIKEKLLARLNTLSQSAERKENQNLFLEFSSTFAIAGLTPNGQMKGAGVGDSFLMYESAGALQFFGLSKGNITIRIRNTESKIRVDTFYPEPEPFESGATDLVMLTSDGCLDIFRKLHENLSTGFRFSSKTYIDFKKEFAGVPTKTQDDKTLAYLGRCHED